MATVSVNSGKTDCRSKIWLPTDLPCRFELGNLSVSFHNIRLPLSGFGKTCVIVYLLFYTLAAVVGRIGAKGK